MIKAFFIDIIELIVRPVKALGRISERGSLIVPLVVAILLTVFIVSIALGDPSARKAGLFTANGFLSTVLAFLAVEIAIFWFLPVASAYFAVPLFGGTASFKEIGRVVAYSLLAPLILEWLIIIPARALSYLGWHLPASVSPLFQSLNQFMMVALGIWTLVLCVSGIHLVSGLSFQRSLLAVATGLLVGAPVLFACAVLVIFFVQISWVTLPILGVAALAFYGRRKLLRYD